MIMMNKDNNIFHVSFHNVFPFVFVIFAIDSGLFFVLEESSFCEGRMAHRSFLFNCVVIDDDEQR